MTNIVGTWAGISIDADTMSSRGYLDLIVVGGRQYPRMFGYMAAHLTEANTILGSAGLLFISTSSTSLTVGTGSRSLTIGAGKGFVAGQPVLVASTPTPTIYMYGLVTSYNSATGALVVTVSAASGSGTLSAWTVSLSGAQGPVGNAGSGTTLAAQADGVNITAAPRAAINATLSLIAADDSANNRFSVALKGDTASPGAYRAYGTDAAGTRGWVPGNAVMRSARSANTILAGADSGAFFDCSGTWTQTFTAAATLGNGWFCRIRNSGAGDITLDPNGSETIDYLTSYIMYPGECRTVMCDGTAFYSIIEQPFYKVFTASSGTGFVRPPGYWQFAGMAWGGGGGGYKDTAFPSGGGGSGCTPFTIPSSALSATNPIVIGAGGIGPSASGPGGDGGVTTFGPVTGFNGGGSVYQNGGAGGGILSGGSGNNPGNPWHGSGGSRPHFGGGQNGMESVYGGGGGGAYAGQAGGASLYGGGGGGGGKYTPYLGGVSVFGGAGGPSNSSTSGGDGIAPGGGGGATETGTKAGNGARGELRIWGVC
jgi:hypothetical protein